MGEIECHDKLASSPGSNAIPPTLPPGIGSRKNNAQNLGSLFLNDLGGFQKAFFSLSTCNTISCVTEYARKLQQMT